MNEKLGVYKAINAVQAELAALGGISKNRKNIQQNYSFRGIDDVYNTLAPILAKHKLLILPKVLERTCEERKDRKGYPLFYVTLKTDFYFTSSDDGSYFVATAYGEAMDSADKATNKAMSAAYKYVCLQAFAIPTDGDNDADSTTHELAGQEQTQKAKVNPETIKQINGCKDLHALGALYGLLEPEERDVHKVAFTKRKIEISKEQSAREK